MVDTMNNAYSLSRHIASEVLIFLISDLDRTYHLERQHAVPIANALKGYSMSTNVLRKMLMEVQKRCYESGLYVPVLSFDGQWARIAVRSCSEQPLTLLQLQKDVYAEARKKSKKEIVDVLKNTNVVHASSLVDILEQAVCNISVSEDSKDFNGPVELFRAKDCVYMFSTSQSVKEMLASKNKNIQKEDAQDGVETANCPLLDTCPPEVAQELANDDDLNLISKVNIDLPVISDMQQMVGVEELFIADNTEEIGEESRSEFHKSMETDTNTCGEEVNEITHSVDMPDNENKFSLNDANLMLNGLREDKKIKIRKWEDTDPTSFMAILKNQQQIDVRLTKYEIQVCLKTVAEKLKNQKIHFAISWNKPKLVALMHAMYSGGAITSQKTISRKSAPTLKSLCVKTINRFQKSVLSNIYSESIFEDKLSEWRMNSPFLGETSIISKTLNQTVTWSTMPEYIDETFTYLFSMLDCHHLFVNARVKCCSTGIPERGIKKEAWIRVAEKCHENGSGLNLAVARDLIDKQSNAFAQKTFCVEVESVMRANGDVNEAHFCRLIREWYEAEDAPGIDVDERIRRRLAMREWLLDGVKFNAFPPYGTHVNGIPYIMFEGLLTNVERRIQVIPFVKSGSYNPRALGSLEAENFFGEFQDLDPKGSGVIRPEDIPKAIETACELLAARLSPNRDFYMHTSRARVYPVHQLCTPSTVEDVPSVCLTPTAVTEIFPQNHQTDCAERARRKGKRKSGEIHKPTLSGRGVRIVREHHRCDEIKILCHVRLGINIDSNI